MIELDLNTISTDELITLQKKINKELERRSGGEIRRLRTQMQKLAKAMGYDFVPASPDSTDGADRPRRRRRKRKTEETPEAVGES
ncbi:MAG: hypothetical protein ACRD5H_07325 [Nitrososphaerales archaeon]